MPLMFEYKAVENVKKGYKDTHDSRNSITNNYKKCLIR